MEREARFKQESLPNMIPKVTQPYPQAASKWTQNHKITSQTMPKSLFFIMCFSQSLVCISGATRGAFWSLPGPKCFPNATQKELSRHRKVHPEQAQVPIQNPGPSSHLKSADLRCLPSPNDYEKNLS